MVGVFKPTAIPKAIELAISINSVCVKATIRSATTMAKAAHFRTITLPYLSEALPAKIL